jgi:N-methylhydantoinase A
LPFPQPLVPRWLRKGIDERLDSEGRVLRPLDEESVYQATAYLKKMKVESIVVTLLFSFLNPIHEKRVKEIIEKNFSGIHVTLSSDVASIPGEYERFTTAVLDAYVRPVITNYTRSLKKQLSEQGFKGQLYFIQNNGGIETTEVVPHKPSTLAISGPAAGPSAAVALGSLNGNRNLLSVDMGGTGFNIAIIDDGRFMTRNESAIANHRFSLDIVDVEPLGTGGGSIAWFDLGGTLRVGPQNAGADPGPACYGNGGEEPTVTDAVVSLGYIHPDSFASSNIKLKKDLAERAIKEKIADRLGISVPDAAFAVYKVFNSLMASGISHAFVTKGYHPGDFVYCAGGSAGPLCALKISEELDMEKVMIPKYAPVYGSFGMLNVDVKHNFSRHYASVVADYDLNVIKRLYKEMEDEGTLLLEKDGVPKDQRTLTRILRMRYYGQFREIEVTWPGGPITKEAVAQGVANFHRRHKELFGSCNENYPLQFITFGLTAVGNVPRVSFKKMMTGVKEAASALKGERDIYFEETDGFTTTRIYDGNKLSPGNILEGPCIAEEENTSVVIPPGFRLHVDDYGNYVAP